jgi:dienelactone hydrolase
MIRNTRTLVVVAAACLVCASGASAEVKARAFDYQHGETVLQGFVAWDDAKPGKRPGVLVVHEWWGHDEHARNQARRLAEAGYVGLALDMYGKGKLTTHEKEAGAFAKEAMKDPAAMRARFNAARAALEHDPHVDPTKIAAIGYCFGGAVVLEQARAGDDLDAVISLHGALGTPMPARTGAVKSRILVLTGGADPFVPLAQVDAFKTEMTQAGATYEVVVYPGAKHSFTNPAADAHGMEGVAYDTAADRQSWAAVLKLLSDVFR